MSGQQLVRTVLVFVAVSLSVQGVPWVLSALFLSGGTSAGFPLPIWTCTSLPPIPGFRAELQCDFSLLGAVADVILCLGLTLFFVRYLGRFKTQAGR